jgi:predicted GNAT family N-acyltransferase
MDETTRTKLDKHNIAAQAMFYRNIEKGLFEIMPDWVRGVSNVQIPSFNTFMPLTEAGLDDEVLADTAAFFFSRRLIYTVELIHDRFPHGPDSLTKRGYQSLPPQPAMFLPALPKDVKLNKMVNIERVKTVPSHTAFYTILQAVFDFELHDVIKLFPVTHLSEQSMYYMRHYLAFIDEQPVAVGTVICKDGVATVRNVCTTDQYRHQGIARTLLYTMLSETNQDGHHLAMLYATAHSYHLFQKFGFEIYTQQQWFLPPDIN